jgi:hypothetical protein
MKATFHREVQVIWSEMEPVRVGEVRETPTTADGVVIVEENGEPRMRIDIYGNTHSAFCDTTIWKGLVVIGLDDKVHFVDVETRLANTVDLDSYFGHLYATDRFLLVASGERLFRFDERAELQWISDELGLDGVLVHDIDDDFISGDGEWDPPGGWKPFRVNVDSGRLI